MKTNKSLKQLAYPLQAFLNGWAATQKINPLQGGKLPASYELTAIKGEAVLRQRFFSHFIPKLPIDFSDEQQIQLWKDLVENGHYLTAWVERLGILKALKREAVLPEFLAKESRLMYTLFLQVLVEQNPDLLAWAVDGYFYHIWKTTFKTAVKQSKAVELYVLQDRVNRLLRKKYNENVVLKESFKIENNAVQFSLIYKTQSENHYRTLVTVERPRVKTARLVAYETSEDKLMIGGIPSYNANIIYKNRLISVLG